VKKNYYAAQIAHHWKKEWQEMACCWCWSLNDFEMEDDLRIGFENITQHQQQSFQVLHLSG